MLLTVDVTIKEEKPTFASVLATKDGVGGIDSNVESDADDDGNDASKEKTSNDKKQDQLLTSSEAAVLTSTMTSLVICVGVGAVVLNARFNDDRLTFNCLKVVTASSVGPSVTTTSEKDGNNCKSNEFIFASHGLVKSFVHKVIIGNVDCSNMTQS